MAKQRFLFEVTKCEQTDTVPQNDPPLIGSGNKMLIELIQQGVRKFDLVLDTETGRVDISPRFEENK
ncbi:MAG: hypothetical protein IJC68_01290 [Firmicutes bacterium]|nr:hypothetical protein [Bacillota bacterium]